MDIFSVLTLIGGLAFFLYGMNTMSSGLERMAGGKLERLLKQITSSPLKSLALGAGITVAIQSSSAVTVMLVGLVNSGIMELNQTIGIIMGSNIGTTLTAWMLSLVGLETDNMWLKLLKPENFSLLFALVGILLIMASKKAKNKDLGSILIGFAILMFGMTLMSDSVSPLADMPEFTNLLIAFKNPILGVLIGTIFTGIIQSSAASIGILQALALTGNITYSMAIPIIMGQNIGTCATALISSIGVNRNAKKVAIIHILIKTIGTVVLLGVYYTADAVVHFGFSDSTIGAVGIAAVHTIFNIATTILMFPFAKGLINIIDKLLPDTKNPEADTAAVLDERLLATPSIAISESYQLTKDIAKLAQDTLLTAIDSINKYTDEKAEFVLHNEDMLDRYEDSLGTYLVKLSSLKLSEKDSRRISKMLHAIGDFERLGDHAVNILRTAEELNNKGLTFSEQAKKELSVLTAAITEVLELTVKAYDNSDTSIAIQIEPLEQVVDKLVAIIKDKHIQRLQAGDCSIELGFMHSDLINSYRRVSDHCSNIAVCIIEVAHNAFDTHKYLNEVKDGDRKFDDIYEYYSKKYTI